MIKAAGTFQGVLDAIESRYAAMRQVGAQNFEDFHRVQRKDHMVRGLVVIDELADLLSISDKNKTRNLLQRIVQISRAAGVHVIAATQRPSVDVVTGVIKANFPARMTFKLASRTDSQVILGQRGGESLVGHGDALFLPSGTKALRVHSPYISSAMVKALVRTIA